MERALKPPADEVNDAGHGGCAVFSQGGTSWHSYGFAVLLLGEHCGLAGAGLCQAAATCARIQGLPAEY